MRRLEEAQGSVFYRLEEGSRRLEEACFKARGRLEEARGSSRKRVLGSRKLEELEEARKHSISEPQGHLASAQEDSRRLKEAQGHLNCTQELSLEVVP